jgi:hypothetical protein
MYVIVNRNGLYLMQVGFDISFTENAELAIKFVAKENAQLKIRKLPTYKHLTVKKIK